MKKMNLFVLVLLSALCMACGSTTRTTVKTNAEQNTVSVSVSTNNPTEWTVDPNLKVERSKTPTNE